jgi:predicted nucleotidyltransferase
VFRSRLIGDLLALMLVDPDRQWTAEELASRTGGAYPTVTRELRRLHEARLVLPEVVGRSKLWRANDRNPHFQPLATLATSSFGPPQVLAEELAEVPGVDEVYLFGSWAARAAGEPGPTPGDIDILVLGRASRRDVNRAMRRAEERLGREVNAVVRTRDEWEAADDGFARQVKSSPLFAVEGAWRS